LILLDTEADRELYTINEGRLAVDLLCEYALTAALDFSGKGMNIMIGCTGGRIFGGKDESGCLNDAEIASALAWPAAIPWPSEKKTAKHAKSELLTDKLLIDGLANLPKAPKDISVLIFALPRVSASLDPKSQGYCLDRFLKIREPEQETDIIFLYNADDGKAAAKDNAAKLADASRLCVNLYNRRPGVHAVKAAVYPRTARQVF
jgi:hypothetical protein